MHSPPARTQLPHGWFLSHLILRRRHNEQLASLTGLDTSAAWLELLAKDVCGNMIVLRDVCTSGKSLSSLDNASRVNSGPDQA